MINYSLNKQKKNNWKNYLFSLIVMLLSLCIGSLVYLMLNLFLGKDSSYLNEKSMEFVGLDPIMDLLFSHAIYIVWFIGIWISIRFIQKRKLKSLITSNEYIDWKKILWGFSLYFSLYIFSQLIIFISYPEYFTLNKINITDFLKLFVIGLIFVPIQTTVEELFFRGFLLQWISKKISHPISLSIIVSLIFGIVHFENPEMGRSAIWMGSTYLTASFILTIITVKLGTLELSIGAHAANNMFITWFISDANSVDGKLPAIFNIAYISPLISFILTSIVWITFYVLSIKKFKTIK